MIRVEHVLACLFAVAGCVVAQLPPMPVPPENPITPEKAVLGKILFWDEQMSSDNTVACGTCHIPSVGGGDPRVNTPGNLHPGPDNQFNTLDDIRGSRGVVRCAPTHEFDFEGNFFPKAQVTGRKAPTFIGVQWAEELFWDGRASAAFVDPVTQQVLIPNFAALESQAVGPLVSDVEMACQMRTHGEVASKIASVQPLRLARNLTPDITAALAVNPTYPQLFQAAFGDPAVTPARIAFAIATYERTLIPNQTPFDAFNAGNTTALTPTQQLGLTVFNGPANCANCHIPPLFTDHSFANIGVRPDAEDVGRFAVTNLPSDTGAFRVPSLRNVGLRAPFFHNGGKATMAEVLLFYKLGGEFIGPNLDIRMMPLSIIHSEELAVIDFVMNGLTDPRVAQGLPPFDRPLLASEDPTTTAFPYGNGSVGSGGLAPLIVAPHFSYLGNPTYTFGVANALGGAPAVLAFGDNPAGGALGNNPLWVDPTSSVYLIQTILGGPSGVPGAGFGSIVFNVPNDPLYASAAAFCQWFVFDPAGPDGIAVTGGAAVTLYQ